jgi:hypothetical protein
MTEVTTEVRAPEPSRTELTIDVGTPEAPRTELTMVVGTPEPLRTGLKIEGVDVSCERGKPPTTELTTVGTCVTCDAGLETSMIELITDTGAPVSCVIAVPTAELIKVSDALVIWVRADPPSSELTMD